MRLLLSLAMLVAALPAWAAPATAREGDDVAKLRAQVEELSRALADLPSLVEQVQAISSQLERLRAEVGRAAAAPAADRDLRASVEALERDLAELQRRVPSLPPPPGPSISASADQGVVVRAGTLRFQLGGSIQARAVFASVPGAIGVASVDLHRGEISLDAEVAPFFAARLSLDGGSGYTPGAPFAVRGGLLRDLFIEARALPWLSLRAGQLKVPFGRQRLTHHSQLAATDRNLATLAFSLDRDLGAAMDLTPLGGRVALSVAVTDGVNAGDRGARNDNLDLLYSARLVLSPLGPVPLVEGDPAGDKPLRFCAGGGLFYGLVPTDDPVRDRDGNGRVDNVEVISAAAEAALAWQRLALQGEYFFRRENRGAASPMPSKSYHGASAQIQVTVVRGFAMLEAHLAWAQPHTLATAAAVSGAPPPPFSLPSANASPLDALVPTEVLQLGGTLVALYHRHGAKAQVGYDWQHRSLSTGIQDAHVLALQLTLAF